MNIKKGQSVIIIAGKDRGKTGKVVLALPKQDKVVVEGINMVNKRIKSRKQNEAGQTVSVATPIHISNVKVAEAAKKATKAKTAKK